MATITVTKGQIGVEDITFMSGGATTGETFSRATSTGGSQAVHKLSAKAIPVEDASNLMTGTNVEAALEDIIDGTDDITLNTSSVITAFSDGTNAITVPTNGMAAAVLMLGNSSTIAWFYLNAAPPGWKVLTTGQDTVLGVKATAKSSGTATTDTANKLIDSGADFVTDAVAVGDVAYNTTDGTSALVTVVDDLNTLTLASDAFPDGNEAYEVGTRFVDPGGNAADEGSWDLSAQGELTKDAHTHTITAHNHQWYDVVADGTHRSFNSGGTAQNLAGTAGASGDIGIEIDDDTNDSVLNADQYTTSTLTATGAQSDAVVSSDSLWRPAASLGRLFQLDTA
jgi:hypothetical protein